MQADEQVRAFVSLRDPLLALQCGQRGRWVYGTGSLSLRATAFGGVFGGMSSSVRYAPRRVLNPTVNQAHKRQRKNTIAKYSNAGSSVCFAS